MCAGVGFFREIFFKPGDTMRLEIEGIGELNNPVDLSILIYSACGIIKSPLNLNRWLLTSYCKNSIAEPQNIQYRFHQILSLSSPVSNISRIISQPPTNSPFTYSCGIVGQSLILFNTITNFHICQNINTFKFNTHHS